jgi:hypothetical protein
VLDNLGNLGRQLSLDQHFSRISHAKICINIATFFDFFHISAPSEWRRASFSRASIKSMSCFGVSIPFRDFFWKQYKT